MRTLKFSAVIMAVSFGVFANPASQTELSGGINTFGYRALQQIKSTAKADNLFISPLSLHEAMSMVYVGSYGDTRTELAGLLGLDVRETNDRIADRWQSLRTALEAADPEVKLAIANSMWGNSDNKVQFKPDFVSLNTRAHGASVRSMNFQASDFLPTINGWVSEKTMGKIPSVLNPPVPKNQLFYLVNAIYFKGSWAVAFDKKNTRTQPFHLSDGKSEDVKMMSRFSKFRYAESRFEGQLVEVPFGKTENLVMTVHVPSSMTKETFYNDIGRNLTKMRSKLALQSGTVSIPRFHIEYKNEKMVDVLKSLDVLNTFSDAADLSGIAEGEEAKINVIIHKAVIDTTEQGAEAAAVTVVGGSRLGTSIERPEVPFTFVADRPFYFEISDKTSGVALFSGVVNSPQDPKN